MRICTKVFAHETIAQAVADAVASSQNFTIGDPLEKNMEVGPLISIKDVTRVEAWVKEAEAGAQNLCGGKNISATCYAPTVLLNPSQDAKVSTEEIFGPSLHLSL